MYISKFVYTGRERGQDMYINAHTHRFNLRAHHQSNVISFEKNPS